MVKAEVEVDGQHGPIVRVTFDGVSVSVYLHAETAVVTTPNTQYGLEVNGPWYALRGALAEMVKTSA